jgi:peptidoglycan/LPS O-acetylase OafA/YrhL
MFYHSLWFSGVYLRHPRLVALQMIADESVVAFIVISGFVITHLLSRREKYGLYLIRRFMRVYPVYLICLVFGIFTSYLNFHTFDGQPWGLLTPATDRLDLQIKSLNNGGFIPHLLAHLTMLHGMISNRILFESEYMFLGPAWSLSLEWQFYLVAPLVIYIIGRSESSRVGFSVGAVIAWVAYQKGLFGSFLQPSFLPGAVLPFGVGIATRLIIYRLPRLNTFPLAAVVLACLVVPIAPRILPYYVWVVLVTWMLLETPITPVSKRINGMFVLLLESKAARYVGNISYPIYLAHAPVLQLFGYICVQGLHLGMVQTLSCLLFSVPFATFIIAALLHRYVEQPFIRLGKSRVKETDLTVIAAV